MAWSTGGSVSPRPGGRLRMSSSACGRSTSRTIQASRSSTSTRSRAAPRLQARLHHHPAVPAEDRHGAAGAEARRPSAQAPPPADARHDAAPGRLEARLARRPAGARPDHHHGRRHQRDLLRLPDRGGRHDEQLSRAGRGDRAAGPVHGALHRSRQPLLLHPGSWRQGLQDPADPGWPSAQAARHRPHPGVLAGSQRPLRARLSHPARSPAQGAGAGRDHHHRGRQPLHPRGLPAQHNARFAEPAEEPAAVFVEVPEALWRDVLCVQEERRVGNDNCVRWHGRSLQIPPTPLRPHLVRATIRVHEYPDGTLAIFKGPQRLASFPPAAPAPAEELAA